MGLTATKYKETEVGLIPEDWDLVPFDKVFTFHSTSNYSKAQMSDDDEVGCIHYGLIHEIPDTQYNLKNGIKYYVSSDQAKYDFVRDGDVIMVDASEDLEGVNKSVEVCGIGNKKYISGLHTYLLRDTNGSLAENFRGILLNSQLVKNQMLQLAVGMKVFGVSKTQLIKVKLPLPPTLTEQKAIAHVLTDTDVLIQALEKKISKKELIKKGVMQKLLTPKESWEEKSLGEVGEGIIGLTYSPNDVRKNGTLVLRSSNVQKGQLVFIDNVFVEMDLPERVIVKENDILICVRNGSKRLIGKCTLIDKKTAGSAFGAFMSVYRSQYSKYVFYVFQSHYIQRQIDEVMGATINQITNKDLNSFVIPFPPAEEQKKIVRTLSDLDIEIQHLIQKKAKYKLAKQGIIQQLLTGKIRLV